MRTQRFRCIATWSKMICFIIVLTACAGMQGTRASEPNRPPEQNFSPEIMLLKLEVPPKVKADQRFPITISYKSSLAPENIRALIKYVNGMRKCAGGHTYDFKINKKELMTVTESSITVDRIYFAKPRPGCTIRVSIEYGDSEHLRETNAVTSNGFEITEKQ